LNFAGCRIEDIKNVLTDKFRAHDYDDSYDSINDIVGSFFDGRIVGREHNLIESQYRRKDSDDDDERHQYVHDFIEQEVLQSLSSFSAFGSFQVFAYCFDASTER